MVRAGNRRRPILIAAAIIGAVAVVSFITYGRSKKDEPAPGPTPSSASRGLAGEVADRVLLPEDLGVPGFVALDGATQTVTDVVARTQDPAAEKARLEGLGFIEAVMVQELKPNEAPGDLQGAAVTIQLMRFASPGGAQQQLVYDRDGALARDFSIPIVDKTEVSAIGDGGFVLRGRDPSPKGGEAFVDAVAFSWESWEAVLILVSTKPLPPDAVIEIAERQREKLEAAPGSP